MDTIAKSMRLTPAALESGLMTERAGQLYINDAGLFAMAGMQAYNIDSESREHCMKGILRVLGVARAAGLDAQMETVILWAFAEEINPADGSDDGVALAKLCKLVAGLVGIGTGRMGKLIEGETAH